MATYYSKTLEDVISSATAPINPVQDQLWWDINDNTIKIWRDTQWVLNTPAVPSDATKAPLASPAFTGVPTVPTAAPGTNTIQIANTAFVKNAVDSGIGAPSWFSITGKPSTFPPTLPIPSSGITGLDAAQSAQDTAIASKAPTIHTHTTAQVTGLDTILADKENIVNKGAVNGYAPLDASQKIPAINLPSYVDDVVEYANLAAFPGTGLTGVIYIALDTNKTYRWGGSSYTEISPSPGSSDAVPEGSTNLYYTAARSALKLDATHAGTGGAAHANVIAAGAAGFITGADKTKLDSVATGANNYVHPTGDGNLHVPVTGTGSNGMVLKAGSTAGSGAWATLTKTDVGLSNVDNTSDANAPISTAQQTALDGKVSDTGDTVTGLLNIQTASDTGSKFIVGGITKGLRIRTNANQVIIEGTDQTGGVSLQQLYLGGSSLNIATRALTKASSTTEAGLNIAPGVAPTTPVNGDLWADATGFYGRAGGATFGPFAAGGGGGEPPISLGTTAQYWRGDKSWQTLDKTVVGLSNVDDTSDAGKPVSTAQATAIGLKYDKTGGTLTGGINIQMVTPDLALDASATTQFAQIRLRRGTTRWTIAKDNVAEGGSNAGADFFIQRHTDAGAAIDAALKITRSTGVVAMVNGATLAGGVAAATTTDVSTATALNVLKTGDTMTGKLTTMASSTAGAGLTITPGPGPSSPTPGDFYINGDIAAYRGTANTRIVLNDGNNQTVGGIKTFTSSPVMPTLTAGDNSTKGATTAYVDAAANASTALAVLKAGDTMTGDLTVTKVLPILNINKTLSGDEAALHFKTGGLTRWKIQSNTTAESANGGSNFVITRHNDAGTAVENAFVITRATGQVSASKILWCSAATAPPAGGTTGTGLLISSTTNFGIFFGSGVPTLSAAQGSIYLRSDGAANARTYVNTNGTTGWIPEASEAVAKTGDTMTGDLIISKVTPQLSIVKSTTGEEAALNFHTAANLRWKLFSNTSAETGSGNTGSNFNIGRYTDAGALIDTPFAITRSSGAVTFTSTQVLSTGAFWAYSGTAIPAGGTANVGYRLSSVANFGIFFGSGIPTLSAAKGSLYLRSDGTSSSTRMYVNSDGATAWVAVTTAS